MEDKDSAERDMTNGKIHTAIQKLRKDNFPEVMYAKDNEGRIIQTKLFLGRHLHQTFFEYLPDLTLLYEYQLKLNFNFRQVIVD